VSAAEGVRWSSFTLASLKKRLAKESGSPGKRRVHPESVRIKFKDRPAGDTYVKLRLYANAASRVAIS
jgi:hypothetical protein